MKAKYRAALMAAAFVFLLPLSARSEIKAGSFEVGPFGGYNFFESNQNLKDEPVFGLRLGYNFTKHFGIEGVGEFISTKVNDKGGAYTEGRFTSPIDGVNINLYHIDAVYHFMPEGKLNPFILAGVGGAQYSPSISTKDMAALNVGVGAKYWVTDRVALRVDLQDYMVTEILQETYHNIGVMFGITVALGGAAKPKPARAPQQAEPVPPPEVVPPLAAPIDLAAKPESDSQINLGWNAVDGATGYKIYRDGPYFTSSKTAKLPDRGLNSSTKYCYRVTATDGTGRESEMSNEACATTLAPPVVMQEQKKKASAAVAKEMFEKGRARINVEFDFDKSDVKPKYHDEIKKFDDVMKDYPDLRVVIEGHTDNVGGKAYNEKLSSRRAKSVVKYMVDKFGIDASRLTAKGYGMSKPIASNKTAAGRQKNRRVEAVVDYQIKK